MKDSEGTSYFDVPELRNTMTIRGMAPPGSKQHGGGTQVLIEGHDISHLVTNIEYRSDVGDATRVTLELIGIRLI